MVTEDRMDEGARRAFVGLLDYISKYPGCSKTSLSSEKVEYYLNAFERNRGNPLLEQVLETAKSFGWRSRVGGEYQDYYGTNQGMELLFRGYYFETPENTGQEPTEMIGLINDLRFGGDPFHDTDMRYEVLNMARPVKQKFTWKDFLEINLSSLSALVGVGIGFATYSDNKTMALGFGSLAVLGLANTVKWFYRTHKREKAYDKVWKENDTLRAFSIISDHAEEIDKFIPFYKAALRGKAD
jgi:hypothetical protein